MVPEYEVGRWVEAERDMIPEIMRRFYDAVDFGGKVLHVQKRSPEDPVRITPKSGTLDGILLKDTEAGRSSQITRVLLGSEGSVRLTIGKYKFHIFHRDYRS